MLQLQLPSHGFPWLQIAWYHYNQPIVPCSKRPLVILFHWKHLTHFPMTPFPQNLFVWHHSVHICVPLFRFLPFSYDTVYVPYDVRFLFLEHNLAAFPYPEHIHQDVHFIPGWTSSILSSVDPVYHSGVCETYRVDTTRFRLSSHRLKIETGRWARIPMWRTFMLLWRWEYPIRITRSYSLWIYRNLRERYADLNFDISCLMQCQNINQLCETCYKVNQLLTA